MYQIIVYCIVAAAIVLSVIGIVLGVRNGLVMKRRIIGLCIVILMAVVVPPLTQHDSGWREEAEETKREYAESADEIAALQESWNALAERMADISDDDGLGDGRVVDGVDDYAAYLCESVAGVRAAEYVLEEGGDIEYRQLPDRDAQAVLDALGEAQVWYKSYAYEEVTANRGTAMELSLMAEDGQTAMAWIFRFYDGGNHAVWLRGDLSGDEVCVKLVSAELEEILDAMYDETGNMAGS